MAGVNSSLMSPFWVAHYQKKSGSILDKRNFPTGNLRKKKLKINKKQFAKEYILGTMLSGSIWWGSECKRKNKVMVFNTFILYSQGKTDQEKLKGKAQAV